MFSRHGARVGRGARRGTWPRAIGSGFAGYRVTERVSIGVVDYAVDADNLDELCVGAVRLFGAP